MSTLPQKVPHDLRIEAELELFKIHTELFLILENTVLVQFQPRKKITQTFTEPVSMLGQWSQWPSGWHWVREEFHRNVCFSYNLGLRMRWAYLSSEELHRHKNRFSTFSLLRLVVPCVWPRLPLYARQGKEEKKRKDNLWVPQKYLIQKKNIHGP